MTVGVSEIEGQEARYTTSIEYEWWCNPFNVVRVCFFYPNDPQFLQLS